ncbi:hypothetical protein [Rathayibacter sp. VKM Ac-2760]|nr:hypothetical protein [Rathayibacter sp. VKM Ac-2760]QHC59987.1 hypothetical protein GSU72_16600 [Rathayibacter sp. VKM Ac-2760]
MSSDSSNGTEDGTTQDAEELPDGSGTDTSGNDGETDTASGGDADDE